MLSQPVGSVIIRVVQVALKRLYAVPLRSMLKMGAFVNKYNLNEILSTHYFRIINIDLSQMIQP